MKQTSITKISDEMDEYPEFSQNDLDRATYKVSGQAVSKQDWHG